jgi:hypothetical protein
MVEFTILVSGENVQFDHFFQNSFMHYFLRLEHMKSYDRMTRKALAENQCKQIQDMCQFLVGHDPMDKNVFCCYTAYRHTEQSIIVFMMYTKKRLRGYGFQQLAQQFLRNKDDNLIFYNYRQRNDETRTRRTASDSPAA